MVFNSFAFLIFFTIVFGLYLVLGRRWQNKMLLAASYIFFGWWDWRFLSLLLVSTGLDYVCALLIHGSHDSRKRKFFLICSVAGNLAILGFFKYFNFFASALHIALSSIGVAVPVRVFNIVLPLGVSFYTFQTMSYTIDVYRGRIRPESRLCDFALFVAFFPQLVAGPIERAGHLLPQITNPRRLSLEKFGEGFYLIMWGLFQKMFIADNLAKIVDPVFASGAPYDARMVIVAVYAFAFQIYCDFAGYSDIARGLGKCMGFDIMANFNLPYFAVNPRDFWQRWHISLSRWFHDYLYVPLGGNRKGRLITYRNLGITMALGGFWHGAAWTYIVWGLYHGLILFVHRLFEPILRNLPHSGNAAVKVTGRLIRTVFFFHLVCAGWLIFRAESMTQARAMFQGIVSGARLQGQGAVQAAADMLFFICVLVAVHIVAYFRKNYLFILRSHAVVQALFYAVCCYCVVKKGIPNGQAFIYFIF